MESLSLLDATKYIGVGFALMTTSVGQVHHIFKATMDSILSQLNEQDKEQVSALKRNYTSFLMNTRSFICCTNIVLTQATTLRGICDAIDIHEVKELIETVQSLLDTFEKVYNIIKVKITSTTSLNAFAKIMTGICALGLLLTVIGVGCAQVLPNIMNPIVIVGASKAAVGGTGAVLAYLANQASKFDEVIKNLAEIQTCLLNIAYQQSKLEGDHKGCEPLSRTCINEDEKFVKDTKKSFIQILERTLDEVTKGFSNLKTIQF